MFNKDDIVVYASTGVCKVDGTTLRNGRNYYVLNPIFEDGVILVPVDTKLFMRKTINKEQALELIDSIPDIDSKVCNESRTNDIKKFYSDLVDEHTLVGLVKTIKSIQKKDKVRNGIGQVDRRYLKRAENTLFGELSVALDIPFDDVKPFIKKRIGQK